MSTSLEESREPSAQVGNRLGARPLVLLFGLTLFVSAALLFSVQPMVARMVLPALGGSPAVWNTCMVFFQVTLLVGYLYAHLSRRLGVRQQAIGHLLLLGLALSLLPIMVPRGWQPPPDQSPIPSLLALLVLTLGFPFMAVSATAPMLQAWFADTGHPDAKDPYFLYAASNLGSLTALLSYPALIEPTLRLADQSRSWTAGYLLLLVLTGICAFTVHRTARPSITLAASTTADVTAPGMGSAGAHPGALQRARWVVLALVPSSLLLGVTAHLTTDISPIPLLWVVPFALYLLTFVITFARRTVLPHDQMCRLLAILAPCLVAVIAFAPAGPLWLLAALHLGTFFVAAMVCHGELARQRPPASHVTEFYLWIALGGALGGLFTALVAPVVFTRVIEYPLALVLACLLRPATPSHGRRSTWMVTIAAPMAVGGAALVLVLMVRRAPFLLPGLAAWRLLFAVPAIVCFGFRKHQTAFGLGLGAMILSTAFFPGAEQVVHRERSFFGVYRIQDDPELQLRMLFSGNTAHGWQSLDRTRRDEPLAYFHREGPIGQVFAMLARAKARPHVAIIGLGTGSMACYGERGQRFTFYEIDPVVQRMAADLRYFTFLVVCRPEISVILGDARLSLRSAPDKSFGLLVLDAFNSDAIPVHLLTREALGLYLTKLAPGGVLAFHISNRHIDLGPVLKGLAVAAGLVGLEESDFQIPAESRRRGAVESRWVVMARKPEDLGSLPQDPRWSALAQEPRSVRWSDDFSNILAVMRWR